ncbi:hypothetical protein P3G55_06655 [Leptospira sp. 96542]|nr:hypothetical protein [Leptospira sp. 96542]
MILTTFVSDLILSLVTFYCALQLKGKSTIPNRAAMYAFIIIGISAGLGSIHFLGIFEFDSIYRFFVNASGAVAVPLIGVAFYHLTFRKLTENFFLIKLLSITIVFIVFVYLYPVPLYATIVGGVSMLIIILGSMTKLKQNRKPSLFAILGAILFITAGLVVGTTGERAGILNVDIFHIMLALANYCFLIALRKF